MRTSGDEYENGRLINGYDYHRQAWVVDGRYVRCGHPEDIDCGCYGREHEDELYHQDHYDLKGGKDMAQIEREVIIKYRWWNEDLDKIDSKHAEALEESAMERVIDMIKEGYTSGMLTDNVRMYDNDLEDGIEYRGWWDISTKNSEP